MRRPQLSCPRQERRWIGHLFETRLWCFVGVVWVRQLGDLKTAENACKLGRRSEAQELTIILGEDDVFKSRKHNFWQANSFFLSGIACSPVWQQHHAGGGEGPLAGSVVWMFLSCLVTFLRLFWLLRYVMWSPCRVPHLLASANPPTLTSWVSFELDCTTICDRDTLTVVLPALRTLNDKLNFFPHAAAVYQYLTSHSLTQTGHLSIITPMEDAIHSWVLSVPYAFTAALWTGQEKFGSNLFARQRQYTAIVMWQN